MSENELKPCPVCGAKAFLRKDTPDGFFMGYSVGCPRYAINDGIHGISTVEEHQEKGYSIFGCFTRGEAIEAWNRRTDNENHQKG